MNTAQLAAAFVARRTDGRCHNALLEIHQPFGQDFQTVLYKLHGRAIAEAFTDGFGRLKVVGSWRGHYTQATQRHLRAIIDACRSAGHDVLRAPPSAREAKAAYDRSGASSNFVIL